MNFKRTETSQVWMDHLNSFRWQWLMDPSHQIACSSCKGWCEGVLHSPTQALLGARSGHFLFLKTSHQAASSLLLDTRLCLHWASLVWIIRIAHTSPTCLLVRGLVGLQSQEELGTCGDFSFLPVEIREDSGKKLFQPQRGSSADCMIGSN